MRHEVTLTGPAFRLRPIRDEDAPFVIELRGMSDLNRYLHAISPQLDDQLAWLASYYERPGDYYFVIERLSTGTPEGLISIYDIDPRLAGAEWGRWILKPGSLAAVESAWLIYRCAFELLGLDYIYCRTVADNVQVVSFHDSCGITARRRILDYVDLGGVRVNAVEHLVDRRSWNDISQRLEKLVYQIARRVQHA